MHATEAASDWILRFAPLVKPGSRVLDLACGTGRHTRVFAAMAGVNVVAVDRDETALAAIANGHNIEKRKLDLEQGEWPLAHEQFDAIVVTNYLWRERFDVLLASIKPSGVLLYETFMRGNATYGRPSRPEFLLEPDELFLRTHQTFHVCAFEQGYVDRPKPAMTQRIACVRPETI